MDHERGRDRIWLVAIAMAGLWLGGGCSGGSSKPATPSPVSPTIVRSAGVVVPPATPRDTGRAAVEALLGAEQKGDHATSFLFLSAAARVTYPTPADWARRRGELPPVRGFHVQSAAKTTVTVAVDHVAGLDPFTGLSPAHETEVWHVRSEGGGWLVDSDPEITPVLAPDRTAPPAALAWAQAVQRCDQAATSAAQGLARPLGQSSGASRLCHATGALSASGATTVPSGPASSDLVAQYTVDALSWARSVTITGGPEQFHVVLAPIGDTWKVIALYD